MNKVSHLVFLANQKGGRLPLQLITNIVPSQVN